MLKVLIRLDDLGSETMRNFISSNIIFRVGSLLHNLLLYCHGREFLTEHVDQKVNSQLYLLLCILMILQALLH